jgi:3-oxoacyl-[acyl-carrier protein] reductase
MSEEPPVALITGGEGDLAQALVTALRQEHWQVLCPSRAELDVTQEASVQGYFQRRTRLDLLINNAGMIADQLLVQMTLEAWDRVQAVNLRGAFLCTRAAVPIMQTRREGHVLFVGSRSAKSGPMGQANYAAAKAGLMGLAQSLAREYGSDNLRFNVILPGYLETKMTRTQSAGQIQKARAAHVLGRFNNVAESARAIVLIAGLENVSGQCFQLDSRIDPWT